MGSPYEWVTDLVPLTGLSLAYLRVSPSYVSSFIVKYLPVQLVSASFCNSVFVALERLGVCRREMWGG